MGPQRVEGETPFITRGYVGIVPTLNGNSSVSMCKSSRCRSKSCKIDVKDVTRSNGWDSGGVLCLALDTRDRECFISLASDETPEMEQVSPQSCSTC